ncbi:unnamed protein product [Echinostoma caproni]|uniref:G domain-containing protein n=1 Tax=Echinostoma caproni TaxID=27848 RepID=A0A3P8J0P9_9TREM|nr:unnamed protein product [Echinostoma caproni]
MCIRCCGLVASYPSQLDARADFQCFYNERLDRISQKHTTGSAVLAARQVCGVVLTPFEKNLEFWRQLWRVVERSDLLVQIVDARQPLLYYSSDLEAYARDVDPNKRCIVLVNKSDFLTEEQRYVCVCNLFYSCVANEMGKSTNSESGANGVQVNMVSCHTESFQAILILHLDVV